MKRKTIWTGFTFFYVFFIFSNSMKIGDLSSADSGIVRETVQAIFNSVGMSSIWITEHAIRKLGHFIEYAILGILLHQSIHAHGFHQERKWSLLAIFGFVVPFLDETIQLFIKGRSGQVSDVWLDLSGILFGILTTLFLYKLQKRTEKFYDKEL
ncbi:VanZ family protein [Clostridium sp. E02]|uniref:VanZ family protein n=1 Tax=Clostridium sp. E02 TaxID=2487134 RepID=UPI0013DD97F0|nr:VanZ family protein [Clostridium sp. E02]